MSVDGPRIDPFDGLGPLEALDPARAVTASAYGASTTGGVEHGCSVTVHTSGAPRRTPSWTIEHPLEVDESTTPDGATEVMVEPDGHHTRVQVRLGEGLSMYGLGEHAGPLLRDGRSHLLWNIDAYGYGAPDRALYQSHPWVIALRPDGSSVGILFDTHRRGTIACFEDGLEATFEGPPYDVVELAGPSPLDVLAALADLVGRPAPVPRWALGYHQCRYSYMTDAEVREVAARLRSERIPCDAIWFDIDYMDRHRVFTWDADRFPEPKALTDALRDDGFRSVAILDPGVVDDDGDATRREAVAGDHLIRTPDGGLAGGRVWPGACHFPDFTREETRTWWAERVESFARESGLDGAWCDMNEPALLGAPTRTLREDAVHRGEPSGSHAEVHNLYGHLMAIATRDGMSAARPGERSFVLTRSATIATGSVAATWTGDNQSHWDDLRWTIPMVLNLGLSGQPMSGPDIGGFTGEPDAELFVRWFELGAYLPFCRGHAEKGTPRKEPWALGDDAAGHVRAALERRMRLLPTLASALAVASETGVPACLPVAFADPTDLRLRGIDDAFLLGSDLLVAPVVDAGARTRRVVLPEGGWYEHGGHDRLIDEREIELDAPLGRTPVLARAGGVVVEGAAIQHTGERDDERVVTIYLDGGGRASASHVEDDDAEDGLGAFMTIDANRVESGGASIDVRAEGAAPPRAWTFVVVDDGRRSSHRIDRVGLVDARLETTPD